MKALRWHAARDVRLEDVAEPKANPGNVVIEVTACGVCGSDLHEYLHGPVYIPKAPHPLTGLLPPVTLGHEFAGRVVALGDDVGRVRVGDRVTVNPCLTCGTCAWCRRGQSNHCAKLGTIGLSRDGALAALVSAPASGCHVLPAEVSDEHAAVVEPLSVAVHACARARLAGGERVAIVGAGPIGLLVLQVLKAKGVGVTIVIEPRADRRALAHQLGADEVLDPAAGDPARAIADLTAGERVDVAFECVGHEAAFTTAVRVTGKTGRIVLVGLVPDPVAVNLLLLLAHEKEIVGSSAYVREFPEAIELLARGRVRVAPLITDRVPLEHALDGALEALLRREETHVKILVTPR